MYSLPSVDEFITEPGKINTELLSNITLTLTTPPNSTVKIFKHVLSVSYSHINSTVKSNSFL